MQRESARVNRELDPISGRAIQVAVDTGLLRLMTKKPQPLEALARGCSCSPRGLRPLLYLLTAVDLIRESREGFFLAPGAMRYVEKKWPAAFAAFPVIPEYEHLESAVRQGRPLRAPVESDEDQGEFFAGIVPTLFDLHYPTAESLAQAIPETVRTVLDLGAGSAVWSLALARQRPEVKVTAVDREKVLREVTDGVLRRHGVREQFELVPGNYHQVELEEAAFDLVYLGHLLHADGWELSRSLLARAFAALKFEGLVAVAEIVASKPRSRDYASNVFDLNMLMLTENGLVFTAAELEDLARAAGFTAPRWIRGPGDYPTLLARKGAPA